MDKRKRQKDRKRNDQKKKTEGLVFSFCPLCFLLFCLFRLVSVLSVLLSFSFGHCVVCPSVFFFCPLCCQKTEGQTTQ
jgi:amino acid permease